MQAAQRERLVRTMSGAPSMAGNAAIWCAICLGLLLVVMMGSQGGDARLPAQTQAAAAAPVSASATVVRSDVHRKQVFDERRENFAAGKTSLGSASAALKSHGRSAAP